MTEQPRELDKDIEQGFSEAFRTIDLSGDIEEATGPWFRNVVMGLGKHEPIYVDLSTDGGDLDSAFIIHDTIREHGNIHIRGYGAICSAGVLILASGHDRSVTANTVLMCHEPSFMKAEQSLKVSRARRVAEDWYFKQMCFVLGKYSKHTARWWKDKLESQAEYWLLGGEQIIKAGLADFIAPQSTGV